MREIEVAIGIIVRAGQVLVCRRRGGDRFEHFWEFPGGKVQPGETAEQALHRELAEELGVRVRVIEPLPLIAHDYGDFRVRLHPFLAAIAQEETIAPRPLAAAELRWVAPAELPKLPFPEANAPLIARLPGILQALAS